MADTNAASGQSASIQVIVDGVAVQIQDKVTGFTVKEKKTDIETKALGGSGTQIDQEFDGFEGSITVAASTAEVDEMMDTIRAAQIARVPVTVNIVGATAYRDASSKAYTYPDCKLTLETSVRRGEAIMHTLTWKTGKDRIAA
jgi:hypothetical protein